MGVAVRRICRAAGPAAAAVLAAVLAAAGCSQGSGGASTAAAKDSTAKPPAATPVQMGDVAPVTLDVLVSGPGRTDVIAEQRVRAPFAGMLVSLTVKPGDRVRAGQQIGAVVSQNSQAALLGARAMLASAQTPSAVRDAERAVELATRGLVRAPIRAARAGAVVARAVSAGDLVIPGDSLVSIAGAGSTVFIAQIPQNEVAPVRVGQPATVDLAGVATPVHGTVNAILPADPGGMNLRVRIDLMPGTAPSVLGLFGTAHIVVNRRVHVTGVPVAALMRNDISGVSRVATVSAGDLLHWVTVTPGVGQGGHVEITAPPLAVGTRVVTMGQVGLPESTHVTPRPATAGAAAPGAP